MAKIQRVGIFFLLCASILFLAAAGPAFGVSPEQMNLLQNRSLEEQLQIMNSLSPSDRQEILRRLTPSQRRVLEERLEGFPAAGPVDGKDAAAEPEARRISPPTEAEAKIRAGGGDTLIVKMAPGSPPPDAGDKRVPDRVGELLGVNVFVLDQDGNLDISGVGRFPVAGLTEDEIALRLSADPMLKDVIIYVTIVPEIPKTARVLEPFGYDLFDGVPSTFAPATDIPVPADYVIGPGDTIQLQLYGKTNAEYALAVSRDGTIQIPEIGPRTVSGLTFSELRRQVKTTVEHQMIGVRASITMGPLRSIRVFVLGDASRPGSYAVGALSTMTNALFASGGVEEIGSLRDIQLKRDGVVVTRLDLYDLLLHGDTRNDARLMPGDVIFVPPVQKTVGIAGAVRRPAVYEIRHERTVQELIRLAGGLLPTASREKAQLERISPDGSRVVVNVSLAAPEGLDLTLADGDVLNIRPVLSRYENTVRLTGHVERPGNYQCWEGMRLSDLIPSMEDFLKPGADPSYVMIKRELLPDRRIQVLSTRLEGALADPGGAEDPLLQPRDEVFVFSIEEDRAARIAPIVDQLREQARVDDPEKVVAVGGRVAFPGEYPLEPGMRISDLIRAGGGLSQEAYQLESELVRYQVFENKIRETLRLNVDLAALLAGEGRADLPLKPFDTVNIKQVPEWWDRQTVEIEGEVTFPGRYVVRKDETLRDLVERAGGFNERAFLEGTVFIRESLRQKEQRQLERLRDRLKADLASISLQQVQEDPQKQEALAMAQGLIQQLESTKAVGRLVIDMEAISRGVNDDIVLQDRDRVIVPEKPQEVTVLGEVNYPTSHVYDPDLSRDGYIQRSGGLTYKADKGRIYIIRSNGQVMASASRWLPVGEDAEVRVGDTIVVPLDADRVRPLYLWSSVAQIVYQISLSIAAADAVGVF